MSTCLYTGLGSHRYAGLVCSSCLTTFKARNDVVPNPQLCDICQLNAQNKALENRIAALEKFHAEWKAMFRFDLNEWQEQFNKRLDRLENIIKPEKKPHKCPVCDGYGQLRSIVPTRPGPLDFTCTPCKGTGVIWS